MPLPPNRAVTYHCLSCHWRKTVMYKSDVRFHVKACPKCGGEVEERMAGLIETVLTKMHLKQ